MTACPIAVRWWAAPMFALSFCCVGLAQAEPLAVVCRSASGRIVGTAGVATLSAQQGSRIWTESRLAPAMAFISEHYQQPVSIRAMAKTCGMSAGSSMALRNVRPRRGSTARTRCRSR